MNKWIACCLVTNSTPYEDLFLTTLLPSLRQWNIPYNIEYYKSRGRWLANVALKPHAILNTLTKYPDSNVVCVDADAKFTCYPQLFGTIPEEYDIALYTLDWNLWYKNNTNIKEKLSGTVWIKNSEKMRNFCSLWYERASKFSEWEQKSMSRILDERPDIKIYDLPIQYCYIDTLLPNGEKPGIQINDPVICHYQASRKTKRLIC